MTGSDLDRAKLISGGVNFILGKSVAEYELPDHEKTQNVFIKEASASQAGTLAVQQLDR